MAIHYRSRGLVLKKIDQGENDQFLTIYTEDFGKLKILGKAIRKIKSKLKSGIELFYLSDIEFIQGKTYKTLTDAIVIEKFKNIKKDLERLKVAYQITELADDLISGQEKDEKIWNLLNDVFNKLDNWELKIENCPDFVEDSRPCRSKLKIIYYYFLWNLLSILGYQIDLYHCVKCQKKLIPGLMNFSSENNGIVCLKCSDDSIKDKILISAETIKILRLFLNPVRDSEVKEKSQREQISNGVNKNWKILSRLKIEDSLKKSLELISENYLSYYKKAE